MTLSDSWNLEVNLNKQSMDIDVQLPPSGESKYSCSSSASYDHFYDEP